MSDEKQDSSKVRKAWERISRGTLARWWRRWELELLGLVTIVLLSAFIGKAIWPALESELKRENAALLLAIAVLVAVFLIRLIWFVPRRQVETDGEELGKENRLTIENAARNTLAQVIGGLFLFLGLAFTWRQLADTQKAQNLTQQAVDTSAEMAWKGQIAERFGRAVDQMGSDALSTRIGGIYSLEQISRDAPSEYHQPILEILTAFVREHASRRSATTPIASIASPEPIRFPEDAQAALNVLLRRDTSLDPAEWPYWGCLDVSGTDLRGANLHRVTNSWFDVQLSGWCLRNADLSNRGLGRTDLHASVLIEANLQNIFLSESDLSRSRFDRADLSGADLSRSSIVQADFTDANLSGANLTEVLLTNEDSLGGAFFIGTDLEKATLVGARQEDDDNDRGVTFFRSNLAGADLSNANLRGSVFPEADLRGTVLSGTDLRGADLSRAKNVTKEQLSTAIMDATTKLPNDLN